MTDLMGGGKGSQRNVNDGKGCASQRHFPYKVPAKEAEFRIINSNRGNSKGNVKTYTLGGLKAGSRRPIFERVRR